MKRVTKFFLALAVVASPMVFTSCDDDDPWNNGYYYDDLVTNAVRNYNYQFPNGSITIILMLTQRSSISSWTR